MHEIKFRAWDKQKAKYIDMFLGFTITDGLLEYLDDIMNTEKTVIIEQYTGLKDVNGTEIYEGDIVDAHWGNESLRVVRYDNEMGYYLTPSQSQDYWTVAYKGKLEVVGNIHNNLELLERRILLETQIRRES